MSDVLESPGPERLDRERSVARGRRAREVLPPAEQGELFLLRDRPDPVTSALQEAELRLPELVPLRHQRMAGSPFAFFRGNALGMAVDLASSRVSGLDVQLCGDAHLANFGLYGSAERRLVFDLNDFDETGPGPWEWDLRRLVTSVVVAGRENSFSRKERRRGVRATARRYCSAMSEFASMGALDVWYARAEADDLREAAASGLTGKQRARLDQTLKRARASDRRKALVRLAEVVDGRLRIKADPPLVTPLADLLTPGEREDAVARLTGLFEQYVQSLPPERRVLLHRYELVDAARKVVGVGSVGTRCWVVLLKGVDDEDSLFLQIKEAGTSVLAGRVSPATATGTTGHTPSQEGERVVTGQRLLQASSDIFLGWLQFDGIDGRRRDFYVRQLKDMKGSAEIAGMKPKVLEAYGALCGWTLARAHARSGDPIAIAAYVGDGKELGDALVTYAEAYADVNEQDHAVFAAAVADGRLPATPSG